MALPPLSRAQVRDVDRRAIDTFGLPGIVLMENAGRGAAELLISLGVDGSVVICAGKGNNGGDGFVIARHLDLHGIPVSVLLFASPDEITGDAAIALGVIQAARLPIRDVGRFFAESRGDSQESLQMKSPLARDLAGNDWIVDALLGTGLQGEVREPYRTAIDLLNSSGRKIFSVDLPSGLDCDSGQPLGTAVRATHTATFVAPKLGFGQAAAADFTGEVHVIDIGVPRALLEELVHARGEDAESVVV